MSRMPFEAQISALTVSRAELLEGGLDRGFRGLLHDMLSVFAHLVNLSGAFVTIETNKLASLELTDKTTNPRDQRRENLTPTARDAEAL